jgi:hypothetical protein
MADPQVYNSEQILEKTLFAQQKVPVYDDPPDYGGKIIGYVLPGNPVGIVYSYLAADPTKGRQNLWWMFYPASNYGNYYYAEQVGGYYDVEALRAQGVISTEEQAAKEEEANLPWYEQLLTKYGKPLVVAALTAGVVMAAVKGYFSRPSKTN